MTSGITDHISSFYRIADGKKKDESEEDATARCYSFIRWRFKNGLISVDYSNWK